MAGDNWQRLGRYITDRMDHLNFGQADLVARSGLSQPTVAALMGGEPRASAPRAKTLRSLEDGLGWSRGSVAVTLAGGEPTVAVVDPTGSATPPDALEARVARLEGVVLALMEQLTHSDAMATAAIQDLRDQLRDAERSPNTNQP